MYIVRNASPRKLGQIQPRAQHSTIGTVRAYILYNVITMDCTQHDLRRLDMIHSTQDHRAALVMPPDGRTNVLMCEAVGFVMSWIQSGSRGGELRWFMVDRRRLVRTESIRALWFAGMNMLNR